MKIAFGSDHAGYELRQVLMAYAKEQGYEVIDKGTPDKNSCDYPVYGRAVALAIKNGEAERGVLCCGSGIGISMAANKVEGIRAVVCTDALSAKLSRDHNNANIIAMGERLIGVDTAKMLFDVFMTTPFSEGPRHIKRIEMIDSLPKE